jgi:hypothetical protein
MNESMPITHSTESSNENQKLADVYSFVKNPKLSDIFQEEDNNVKSKNTEEQVGIKQNSQNNVQNLKYSVDPLSFQSFREVFTEDS